MGMARPDACHREVARHLTTVFRARTRKPGWPSRARPGGALPIAWNGACAWSRAPMFMAASSIKFDLAAFAGEAFVPQLDILPGPGWLVAQICGRRGAGQVRDFACAFRCHFRTGPERRGAGLFCQAGRKAGCGRLYDDGGASRRVGPSSQHPQSGSPSPT